MTELKISTSHPFLMFLKREGGRRRRTKSAVRHPWGGALAQSKKKRGGMGNWPRIQHPCGCGGSSRRNLWGGGTSARGKGKLFPSKRGPRNRGGAQERSKSMASALCVKLHILVHSVGRGLSQERRVPFRRAAKRKGKLRKSGRWLSFFG